MSRPVSLRDRILAWYCGTLLAFLGLVLALVHVRLNAETGRHLQSQMDRTQRVVEGLQNDRTATLAVMARLAGEEPRLGSAMTTRDPPTLDDLLRRDVAPRLQADFVRVTDERGITMADTSDRVKPWTDLSRDPVVRVALSGQVWPGLLIQPGEIFLAAAAPIRLGGQDLGTVTVGRRVDHRLATQLSQETGSEVSFFAEGRLAATSWPADARDQLQEALAAAPVEAHPSGSPSALRRDSVRSFRMTMNDQRLMCRLIPLHGPEDRTGQLLIQSNLDAALRPYANIQRGLAAIGLVGLVVAVIGSIVVAGGITGPLRRIARAAQGLMQGDWSQRAPVTSRDEVGLLAETFNRMAERLERWDGDLRAAVADRTRDLNAAVARLDEAFHQMRRFNADASHELRTPLTVIRGEAEVALRTVRTPEEYQLVLCSIQEETERMSRIIEQLLLLARADSGELRLERHQVALDDVVREVVHRAQVLADKRRISLRAERLDSVLMLGDEDRLHQLVLNLIDNAIKYTPEGGQVWVRLSGPPTTSGQGSESALLEVEDTGSGIDPAHLPHIFERFYRVDKARSRSLGGCGLGLSICRWIAEVHGGRIEVRSQPGKGTTFTVQLPALMNPSLQGAPSDFVEV